MSYHRTPLRTAGIKKNTNVGKDVEKRKPSYTVGGERGGERQEVGD